jgi:flavin-binding protein dodecin
MHESGYGTFRTCRDVRVESAFRGNPEDFCSHRVLLSLTHFSRAKACRECYALRHLTAPKVCRADWSASSRSKSMAKAGGVPASCFHTEWEDDMPESVYDVILLIGSSKESWEKAAADAVEQASKSLRDVRVAEIVQLDMQLDAKGKVEAYRAKVRLSFKVES